MLTPVQLITLNALADRLIPADDTPGAVEAGAVNYLLHQFERDLAAFEDVYAKGLDSLDQEAQETAGMPFARMPASAQDELLRRVEQGEVATPWAFDPASFMRHAAEHLAEGFYSDPGNGGNNKMVAWQMIGFAVTG
jgi:Gluconate 2-dehydrogenase subunit 3